MSHFPTPRRLPERDTSLAPGQLGERERGIFNRLANTQAATGIAVVILIVVGIVIYQKVGTVGVDTLTNRQAGYENRAALCDNIILNHPGQFVIATLPKPCQDPPVTALILGDPNASRYLAPAGTPAPKSTQIGYTAPLYLVPTASGG